jgi:hypothetical protein
MRRERAKSNTGVSFFVYGESGRSNRSGVLGHLNYLSGVIPAKAGIHFYLALSFKELRKWIPAFAGMTPLQEGFKQQMTPVPAVGLPAAVREA